MSVSWAPVTVTADRGASPNRNVLSPGSGDTVPNQDVRGAALPPVAVEDGTCSPLLASVGPRCPLAHGHITPSLCLLLHTASALCLPLSPSYKKNPSLWMCGPPQAGRSSPLTSLTDDICKDPGSAPHWLTVSPGCLRASTCPSVRWTRLPSLRDPAASKRLPDPLLELWTDSSAPDSRAGPGCEGLAAKPTALLLSQVKHLSLIDVSPNVGRRPQCPDGGAIDSGAFLAISALSRHWSMGNGWFWISND